MNPNEANALHAARRAYEAGRARTGAVRALVVMLGIAALTVVCCGARGLVWMPLAWALWTFVEWRGVSFRRGAVRGLVAGAATLALPATWLRACCEGMENGAACRAPQACALIGAAIGVALALSLPMAKTTLRGVEAAAGAATGVVAVTAARCALLLGGEALGLAVGIGAGLVAASVARGWLAQRAPSEV